MKKRIQITVKGNNVQRCGFRKTAMEMARTLHLTGTAMYIDHDILIEVEGSATLVDEFAAWAAIGPSECNINAIEEREIPIAGETSFQIVPGIVTRRISA